MEAMVPKVKALLGAMLPNMEVKDVNKVQEHWDEFVTKVTAELEPLWQQSEDEPQVTPDEEIKIGVDSEDGEDWKAFTLGAKYKKRVFPPKKREREEKDK